MIKSYRFARSQCSIFTEIYFPKKAAYQGEIYDALRDGLKRKIVHGYLRQNSVALRREFAHFPSILDPYEYTNPVKRRTKPSLAEVEARRIDKYKSSFYGWSTYSVDGVFLNHGRTYEEATQVVRILFRFTSSFTTQAIQYGAQDVLRSILWWVISQQGRLNEHKGWSDAEKAQYIARHEPWPTRKRAFVDRYFTRIAKAAAKWSGDRGLFLFGYLVRRFWKRVIDEEMKEDEIWITSFLNQQLNIYKPIQ